MLDFDLDETSVSGFHKHTRQTAPANQSTTTPSTKSPRPYSPRKPIRQTTTNTHCRFHKFHTHTVPQTHHANRHTTLAGPDDVDVDADALDVDADAASVPSAIR